MQILNQESVPVITIDGPSGSGKGTIASLLAHKFGFHLLDSGAIYRTAGLAAAKKQLLEDVQANRQQILETVLRTKIHFEAATDRYSDTPIEIFLNDINVTREIRTEEVGTYASQVGAIPEVRQALLALQHAFVIPPGLIADGRDMGTVIFPQACAKIYLTASAEARALRRLKQLQNSGFDGNLTAILETIRQRDLRDTQRAVAPLKPAADAFCIDGSDKSIDEVMALILNYLDQSACKLTHG